MARTRATRCRRAAGCELALHPPAVRAEPGAVRDVLAAAPAADDLEIAVIALAGQVDRDPLTDRAPRAPEIERHAIEHVLAAHSAAAHVVGIGGQCAPVCRAASGR